jgi:hypothetical protein
MEHQNTKLNDEISAKMLQKEEFKTSPSASSPRYTKGASNSLHHNQNTSTTDNRRHSMPSLREPGLLDVEIRPTSCARDPSPPIDNIDLLRSLLEADPIKITGTHDRSLSGQHSPLKSLKRRMVRWINPSTWRSRLTCRRERKVYII